MAIDKDKNAQILVTFPHKVVAEIEEYWHANRMKNRNEAIRDLVTKGLKNAKEQEG